jgi:hypothetical protein
VFKVRSLRFRELQLPRALVKNVLISIKTKQYEFINAAKGIGHSSSPTTVLYDSV